MFKSWRVTVFTINQKDGEAEKTTRIEDEQEAILKYHSECASYGSNAQTKYCTVYLFDPAGGLVRKESFSQPALEPVEE